MKREPRAGARPARAGAGVPACPASRGRVPCGLRGSWDPPGAALLSTLLLLAAVGAAPAVPTGGLRFEDSGDATERYIQIAGPLDFRDPITFETWMRPEREQPLHARLLDAGNGTGLGNFALFFCPNGTTLYACSNAAGTTAFVVHLAVSADLFAFVERYKLFQGRGIPLNVWSHVAVRVSGGTLTAFLNGTTTEVYSGVSLVPASPRFSSFIGRSNWPNEPYIGGITLAGTRLWTAALTDGEVAGLVGGIIPSRPRAFEYALDGGDCTPQRHVSIEDRSGSGATGTLHGDVALQCPPYPTPAAGLYVPDTGPTDPKYLAVDVGAGIALAEPLTLEAWLRPERVQPLFGRLWECGSGVWSSNINMWMCPAGALPECPTAAGTFGLQLHVALDTIVGSHNLLLLPLFRSPGIPVGSWSHVAVTLAAVGSAMEVRAYLNGRPREVYTGVGAFPSGTRLACNVGKVDVPGDVQDFPFLGGIHLQAFRLWAAALSSPEIVGGLSGRAPTRDRYLDFALDASDCGPAQFETVEDRSGHGRDARIVGPLQPACPLPAPAANATLAGSALVALAVRFAAGQRYVSLEATCEGFGGPYEAAAAVTDADADGGLLFDLPVTPASGPEGYPVSCRARARSRSGLYSPDSAPANASVPAAGAGASQSALLPAGNAAAFNQRLLVDSPLRAAGSASIVFAVPLAGYPLAARPASLRLGLLLKSEEGLTWCDLDLVGSLCSARLALPAAGPAPSDFSYASMSPWPALDPDFRPARPARPAAFDAGWPWEAAPYAARADLVGPVAAAVLRSPAECAGAACRASAAQRWAGYAYSGCDPGPAGAARPWPAAAPCAAADAFAAVRTAGGASFRASYERTLYEAASGSGADPRWLAMLGTLHLFAPGTAGGNGSVAALRGRHAALQTDLLAGSPPAAQPDAYAPRYPSGSTNCREYYDVEPAEADRGFEQREALADVRRAYGAGAVPRGGLVLQDSRHVALWGRGSAFFASWAATEPSQGVLALLKACSLPAGVALLAFNRSALAPPGYGPDASAAYRRVPWPTEPAAAFADAFPPAASLQALQADGRVADGGPLLYHAVVRLPFFPLPGPDCPAPLAGGTVCGALTVAHVTAALTWEVRPEALSTLPVAAGAASALAAYRAGVALHGAPRLLRTDLLPLSDHWIVQNERPLVAGPGHGFLEGRFVDPDGGGPFAFYVTGDAVYRLARPAPLQGGAAGSLNGTLRIYGGAGWAASRAEWTSVAAAAYKDGRLYVVREVHTAANTRSFAFGTEGSPRPRLVPARRLARASERAPTSQLVRVSGVDGATLEAAAVDLLVPAFPATVLSAHVLPDFAAGAMFGFGGGAESARALPEAPFVLFVVASPPTLVRMRTDCPPGERWNWEAAVAGGGSAADGLCRPLPAGLHSARGGLLVDGDALPCPPGTWSAAGSLACRGCPRGTWSDPAAAACFDCPQHTYVWVEGQPCTACPPAAFTLTARWTSECRMCQGGDYFPGVMLGTRCITCPQNTWSPPANPDPFCYPCPAGSYPRADQKECVPCRPGWHQPLPDAPCLPCPAGTVSGAGQGGNCSGCPAGFVAGERRTECRRCRPGHEPADPRTCAPCGVDAASPDGGPCVRCGPGLVSPSDALACLPCHAGTYEAGERPGECRPCPHNHVAPLPGATNCSACPLGTVASPDARLCLPCAPGTYRGAAMPACGPVAAREAAPLAASAPAACPAGSVPGAWREACGRCPAGTFQSGDDCPRCPANHASAAEGAAACSPCPAGHVAAADLQGCLPCPLGTYRSAAMGACEPLPPGAVTNGTGASNFSFCTAGSVPNAAGSGCVPCPKGSFANGTACSACPANRVAPARGSTACAACPPGSVASADRQTCLPCPAGTYRPANASACMPVPPDAVAGPGRASYDACGPGTVPDGGRAACLPCGKGTFESSGACVSCPLNAASASEAATACGACGEGSVARPDAQGCAPCLLGWYRAGSMAACERAPPRSAARNGTLLPCGAGLVPDGPRAACVECSPGSFQREDACEPCPTNRVAPLPGRAACEPCPEGAVSSPDRQQCLPCPAGFYRHEPLPDCTAAPRGAVALPGARNYSLCGRGSVPNAEETECVRCERGTVEADLRCVPCAGGTSYAPEPGMAACVPCPLGAVASADGQGCDPCPRGSYRGREMAACGACPFGSASGAPGLPSCTPCPRGTEATADRTACRFCRAGAHERNGTCAACPDGAWSAPGAAACAPCPAGFIASADRSGCLRCPAGTFRSAFGPNACVPCREGQYAPAGSGACRPCDLGSCPSPDAARCVPCEAGSFMLNGTASCQQCPEGTYAPRPGAGGSCADCSAGFYSAPDRRHCLPCPPGSYRAGGGGCLVCPLGTFSSEQGAVACPPCPSGTVPRADRADCTRCEAGSVPVAGACERCPAASVASAGDERCSACPEGHVANEARSLCAACPAGTQRAAGEAACAACPRNAVSGEGAAGCAACAAGRVSDEGGTFCAACSPGTFRNASLAYCAPCDAGTYAAGAGAAACSPCSAGQLCPVATASPIDAAVYRGAVAQALGDALNGSAAAGRRRLLAAAAEEGPAEVVEERVAYDTTAAAVRRAAMPSDAAAAARLQRLLVWAAVAAACLLAGAALAYQLHIRYGLSCSWRPEKRRRRAKKWARYDRVYTDEVWAARQAARRLEANLQQTLGGAPGPGPGPERRAGGGQTPRREASIGQGLELEQGAALPTRAVRLQPASSAGASAGPPPPPAAAGASGTVTGAWFALLGVGAALFVAAAVVLQFAVANYSYVQGLSVGASPSIAAVAGPWSVSATFVGFAGPCEAAGNGTMAPGVHLAAAGVRPLDGQPPPTLAVTHALQRRSCTVAWSCERCRIAANEAHVDFRLVARLAFAVAVNFAVAVPHYASIAGTVRTAGDGQFAVFRGLRPVEAPVLLTPVHFVDDRDGSPRFDASLHPAANREAERGESDFGLCSLTRPLEACPGEAVAFRAAIAVSPLHLVVSRAARSSPLDAASDVSSLAQGALSAGGLALLAYAAVRPPPAPRASLASCSRRLPHPPPCALLSPRRPPSSPAVAGTGQAGARRVRVRRAVGAGGRRW